MLPEWVSKVLADNGLAGVFIGVLLIALIFAVKHIVAVGKMRLSERDDLNAALTGAARSIDKISEITEERNEVTEDLTDAITQMGAKFERLNDRVSVQYDGLKDKAQEQGLVIASFAEAMRVNNGLVTGIRDFIQNFTAQAPPRNRRGSQ